eukprot:2742327-Rhodomonas_salina.1
MACWREGQTCCCSRALSAKELPLPVRASTPALSVSLLLSACARSPQYAVLIPAHLALQVRGLLQSIILQGTIRST